MLARCLAPDDIKGLFLACPLTPLLAGMIGLRSAMPVCQSRTWASSNLGVQSRTSPESSVLSSHLSLWEKVMHRMGAVWACRTSHSLSTGSQSIVRRIECTHMHKEFFANL